MNYNKSSQTVYAVKINRLGMSESGKILPVFIKENNRIINVDERDFPSMGEIFVRYDYSLLDSTYDEGFLFEIEFSENTNSPEKDYYKADGKDAIKITKSSFLCPIIEGDCPDPSEPYFIFKHVPTRNFFIHDGEFIYGPFSYVPGGNINSQDKIVPATSSSISNRKEKYIYKFELSDIAENIIVDYNQQTSFERYLIDENLLDIAHAVEIDFIQTEDLLSWASKAIFANIRNKPSKTQVREISEILKNVPTKNEITKSRVERLVKQLENAESFDEQRDAIVESFVSTSKGQKYLDSYVTKRKEELIESRLVDISKELKEKEKHLSLKKDELEEKVKSLQENIKILHENETKEKERVKLEYEKEFESLIKQKDQVSGECAILETKKKTIESRYLYLQEIANLEEYLQKLRTQENIIKKELESLFKPDSVDFTSKISETKILLEILNGTYIQNETSQNDFFIPDSSKRISEIVDFESMVNCVKENFEKLGRSMIYAEIANILISIHLNFLTIFSGVPGVGKTSLVHYLAKVLGNEDNLLKVSTSRGWSSSKDLLGYYNPLKNNFQKSKTGVYDFIKSSKNLNFPRWILLDEANLSPMEHYWADFLQLCDSEGINLNISLGIPEDEGLVVDKNLRFIGTVNIDHTTENLSPRLIDRSCIIHLDTAGNQLFDESLDEHSVLCDFGRITLTAFPTLDEVKKHNNDNDRSNDLDSTETKIVKDIFDILTSSKHDYGMPLGNLTSYRKKKKIVEYCVYARYINLKDSKPIDFAISQYVIPSIVGFGDKFGERLNVLEGKLRDNQLFRSEALVRQLRQKGEYANHFYSFFG